jgi:uncharacterized membrane protein YjjB (DUF3815 family)
LPVDQAVRVVPLWQDLTAAGVAVASYSIFFSRPPHLLPWPVIIGMLAHALLWEVLAGFGSSAAMGTFAASLTVGLIVTPVVRRSHMPFAAIGFACVVSMMPGVYLFRMASGVLQMATGSPMTLELINATIADGVVALTITLAMSLGLIVPKMAIDWLAERLTCVKPQHWKSACRWRGATTMIQSRKGVFHRNTLALPIALAVVFGIGFAANLDRKA